jgi:hypothetical protein
MKDDLLKFLSDTVSRESTYHNHKETIAWAALLLYFILVGQIVDKISCQSLSTVILLVAAYGVVYVLCFQYGLRKEAANTVAACQRLIAEFLPMEEPKFAEMDFKLADLTKSGGEDRLKFYNLFSKLEKIECRSRSHYPYILPKFVLDKMEELNKVRHSPRKGLERVSYLLVFVATFAGLVIIWS